MIRRANAGVWCDYCKDAWGTMKDNSWHPKAKTPAWLTIDSESVKSKKTSRSYCQSHAEYLTEGSSGQAFTFEDQIQLANQIEGANV